MIVIPKATSGGGRQRDLTSGGVADAVARFDSFAGNNLAHVPDKYVHRKVPLSPAFSVRVRDDNQFGYHRNIACCRSSSSTVTNISSRSESMFSRRRNIGACSSS